MNPIKSDHHLFARIKPEPDLDSIYRLKYRDTFGNQSIFYRLYIHVVRTSVAGVNLHGFNLVQIPPELSLSSIDYTV